VGRSRRFGHRPTSPLPPDCVDRTAEQGGTATWIVAVSAAESVYRLAALHSHLPDDPRYMPRLDIPFSVQLRVIYCADQCIALKRSVSRNVHLAWADSVKERAARFL
jgi:hypothetical protein